MKIKKTIKYIGLTAILVFIIGVISVLSINSYVKSSVSDNIMAPDTVTGNQYDCIMVLGCGVMDNGQPSWMLADRLDTAIELYHAGKAPKIIMSGDHGQKEYDEVNIMRLYAEERGVPEEDIFMDHAGFSTYESMYRARDVFCISSMVIVTQKYHLYRALYIAESLGINSIGVNSDPRQYYGQIMRDIREVAARCKDFLKCIIKPEPTFLGDAIPISGSGLLTRD